MLDFAKPRGEQCRNQGPDRKDRHQFFAGLVRLNTAIVTT